MAKAKLVPITGDEAAAYAMKQIEPDVVAAYPITPQTEIVMNFAQYVADGKANTEMIPVESEHSAMSACVGAAASGARTMTATSANGLALMWEILYIAASTRLPIVMSVVNRALSAPINIHCDHSDSMGARDSGWIQIYCENTQEVYESIIMAVRLAEHPDVQLPVMVCQDGFITSHAVEGIELFEDRRVKDFIGEYKPRFSLLNVDKPITVGPLDLQDFYFEHKRQQSEAMKKAIGVIPEVFNEFEKTFGKRHNLVDRYRLDDAEVGICVLSSTAGTSRGVVDMFREEGLKVGLLKPRFFRPFPGEDIVKSLSHLKAVAVLDRSESFSGEGGPLFSEVKAALYEEKRRPEVINYIYGLGGRDIFEGDVEKVVEELLEISRGGTVKEKIQFLGVRE